MRIATIILFVLVFSNYASAQAGDSTVVVSGKQYSFSIHIPGGWKCESGSESWTGADAILFPRSAHKGNIMWGNPDAWITIGIAGKQSVGDSTLTALRKFYESIDAQEGNQITPLNTLSTKDGKTVLMNNKRGKNSFGAMAFIEDSSSVVVFELRRFDEPNFNDAFPKFKQMIESFQALTVQPKEAK